LSGYVFGMVLSCIGVMIHIIYWKEINERGSLQFGLYVLFTMAFSFINFAGSHIRIF
jgi:hypothetical protein